MRIMHKVFAQTVVLGWEHVQDESGKEIPFTVENCITLFETLPDLFLDIQDQAKRAALFRAANREAAAGN